MWQITCRPIAGIEIGREVYRGRRIPYLREQKKDGSGIPLNDEDRLGWLTKLGDLASNDEEPLIISCSALKRSYRELLGSKGADLIFIHLHARREVIESRINLEKGISSTRGF